MSTFLRRRKSVAGSFPNITGVVLRSLETEGALDIEGRDEVTNGLGVGALDTGGEELDTRVGPEAFRTPSIEFRLRLMIAVSSFLNLSRSVNATGCGEMNVKLCPTSSPMRPTFSLTCGEPSLLQKRAFVTSECKNKTWHENLTHKPHQSGEHGLQELFYHPESIADGCL